MMIMLIWVLGALSVVAAVPSTNKEVNNQGYKDQYCTDPRTMRKHPAYTEWADAYSCTRHRCQPGGRNLAIYTVGCKRVEAPESAIECEEVVEDTNMQFPFCCTRLRCLVVVRGEVWTRVLGQPWEVLPAAPWSHMYKMKKPPPTDTTFQPKVSEQGPIYELTESESDNEKTNEKVQRSGRKVTPTTSSDCNEAVPRASLTAPGPDIVIALSTNNDKERLKNSDRPRRQEGDTPGIIWGASAADSDTDMEQKHSRKSIPASKNVLEKESKDHAESDIQDLEDPPAAQEKPNEGSEEKLNGNMLGKQATGEVPWTEIPQNQWNGREEVHDEPKVHVMALRYTQEPGYQQEIQPEAEVKIVKKEEKMKKPNNLQALVDAIGTRMKDIENVVQRMSEKVHQTKNTGEAGFEKRKEVLKVKNERDHSESDGDHYKSRFSVRNRGSKYLHLSTDPITTQPPNREDSGNYFSDASNAVRRANLHQPKEPAQSHPTYMAPVDTHHKTARIAMVSDTSEDLERRKKKRGHKKRKSKIHVHKKRHNQEKRKHFNKLSAEIDKNAVSLEDSSAVKD